MKTKILIVLISSSLLFGSCIGSFSAFNGLKDWNTDLTGNKFGDEVVFLGLNIIPVYGLFSFADLIIFNSIEFWTGSNPLAIKNGDKEIQIVERNEKKYQLTATQNKMNITVLEGDNAGESVDMKYVPVKGAWILEKDGKKIKLADYEDGMNYVYLPNGEGISILENLSKKEALDKIENAKQEYIAKQSIALN